MHSNLVTHQAGGYLRPHPLPPNAVLAHHQHLLCICEMLRGEYLLIFISNFYSFYLP